MFSNAAEDESPEPLRTLEEVHAEKPPTRCPFFTNASATPAIRASDKPKNALSGVVYEPRSTTFSSCPALLTRTMLSEVRAAAAIMSRSIDAAMTLPWLWSVWFPESSLRPGTENSETSGDDAP